ncbi:hypothetical protein [Xanthobacter autotrophicus]|uniref:hypothetical protein n=1 Tax=Xanthobacter autotrophicus TaxID=280 RepID=UPI00372B6CFE
MTMDSTAEAPATHLEALRSIAGGERMVARWLDAHSHHWGGLFGHARHDIEQAIDSGKPTELAGQFKDIIQDIASGQCDQAKSTVESLIKNEAAHVSAQLGSIIQAMAEFTSEHKGQLESVLQNADSPGLGGLPHLAAWSGSSQRSHS